MLTSHWHCQQHSWETTHGCLFEMRSSNCNCTIHAVDQRFGSRMHSAQKSKNGRAQKLNRHVHVFGNQLCEVCHRRVSVNWCQFAVLIFYSYTFTYGLHYLEVVKMKCYYFGI